MPAKRFLHRHAHSLAAIVLLVGYGASIATMPEAVMFDGDEGFNLIKARLVGEGHSLYTQVWSDQPPVFTYLLRGWAMLFGESVRAARMLTVTLAVAGVWTASRIVASLFGQTAGLLSILLVFGSRRFGRLAMSVMIGLPAIAIGLVALWLILAARRRWTISLLIASGLIFSLALQTKLFTFMMLPLALGLILYMSRGAPDWKRAALTRTACWAGALLAGFAAITLATSASDPAQLVAPHVGPTWDTIVSNNLVKLVRYHGEDAPITIAALIGIIHALDRRRRHLLLPLLWLIASAIALTFANPFNSHHRLMLTIPLCMLGAIGCAAVLRDARLGRITGWWRTLLVGGVLVILAIPTSRVAMNLTTLGRTKGRDMVDSIFINIQAAADRSPILITDNPMYAYVAGLSVPPELAVTSAKRWRSGELSSQTFEQAIARYNPAQIYFERFEQDEHFLARLATRYRIVATEKPDRVLYWRHDVDLKPLTVNPQ